MHNKKHLASLTFLALIFIVRSASSQLTVSVTNQTGSVPLTPAWTAASDSLISGLIPTVAKGNFGEYTGANATNLTQLGVPLTIYAYTNVNPPATNLEVCGNDGTAGSLLVYTMPPSTYGYNLTNITVYGGWLDDGRDAQDYTIYYSTATDPTNFTILDNVSYLPSNPSDIGDATRVLINDATGAAIANNVAALRFDFTIPDGASRENGAAGYTAITAAGVVATNIVVETNGSAGTPIWGSSPITEPYPYVSSGSFSGPAVPLSPDPLVAYRWPKPQASDGLHIYLLKPTTVSADSNGSFDNLQSLTSNNPNVTVNGTGSILMDFGQENAAWLEFDSPDLPSTNSVEMSISEYNQPEIVNGTPKTLAPTRYGNTYRLELNPQLYEGVRFGWIQVTSFTNQWHITGLRLVCQTKPANYNGSFSCSDPMLTRIWYDAAYDVKLNLEANYFGAVLIDRGDRIGWTGDDHCSQAAALAAFGNDDFIKENLANTANNYNGIASYALYWVLSLIDYYNYTGDSATLGAYITAAQSVLDNAYSVYGKNPGLSFYGWDERLGAGFENANCAESENAYEMLSIEAWQSFATAMGAYGRTDLQAEYSGYANQELTALRGNPVWYQAFGLHACSDAVNTGLLNPTEKNAIFAQEFTDRVNRVSYSAFNQYFVIQAFAGMDKYDDALSSINDLWGGEIRYGGTTFFEVSRPSWDAAIGINDPVPDCQAGWTSLCHPWSAGVVKWLSENVLGIQPTSPGFAAYKILPHPGSTLSYVAGQTPTPFGLIQASFNVSNGLCAVSSPPGTLGTVGVPKVGKTINSITVNGTLAWDGSFHPVAGIGGASQDSEFVYFTGVQPGSNSLAVSYTGSTPAYNEPPEQYAARFIKSDSTTSGNWGGVYGKDGYVLCNYHGNGTDQASLPSYVSSVTYYGNSAAVWASGTNDDRALAPNSSNQNPRNATCVYGTPTWTFTINSTGTNNYQVALYFVDWDNKGRRLAVEMFDANSLNLITPVEVITNYTGGKYLVYEYNKSVKFRIDEVRGDNAVLSGIFFDPAPATNGPALAAISDKYVHVGETVQFSAPVMGLQSGSPSLAFSLSNAPAGASINPSSGDFSWVTTNALVPSTNSITVNATQNGTPPLSNSQTFSVFVSSPPQLTGATIGTNNQVQLQFNTLPGQNYQVQFTTSLTDGDWTTLGGDIHGAGLPLTVSDNSTGGLQRYYRLVAISM